MTAVQAFTGYDRSSLVPTVVHLGPGVFHRAHQAVYSDLLLRNGERSGAIWGLSLRSPAVRDALQPNGFVYHVVELGNPSAGSSGAGVGGSAAITPVGSLLGVDVVGADVQQALARLIDPSVSVVTITVTEHGYCAVTPAGPLDLQRPEVTHDLEHPTAPRSLPGLIVEALKRRRASGTAPFTVASCDNLPGNGQATARVVLDYAECRDSSLAGWIRANVAFPSSMVDRMVPATTEADLQALQDAGYQDRWPVITEPFSQWVLEDTFPYGRPAWERAGVDFVPDVRVHEQAKLRILNAAHSALAYWGLLAGHELVWSAATDPVLAAAVRELLVREVLPTLTPPPGWDLGRYADQVLERFSNSALPYTTAKVAADGSQKLAVRLMPTVRAHLEAGTPAPRSVQVVGAWVACVAGPRAAALGVQDAQLARGKLPGLEPGASLSRSVSALLAIPGFFPDADPRARTFRAEVERAADLLQSEDPRTVLIGPKAAG